MTCTFFFSYARSDGGAYLNRFFRDLVGELNRLTGRHEETDLVFRDTTGIQIGERWPVKISDALMSCRIFLSLQSPTYFNREFCGKEWKIFQSRLEAYANEISLLIPPPLIIPIYWIPLPPGYRRLPQAVTTIQWSHSELGELYANEGLFYLLRHNKSKDYREAVYRLAKRLVALEAEYKDFPRADHLIDLATVESAFSPLPEAIQESRVNNGVNHVQFVIVAGHRDELKAIRKIVTRYGNEAVDWCPYCPTVAKRIGATAQHVASEENLTSEFMLIDYDLSEGMKRAKKLNNVVIFIVDPWTVGLDKYRLRVRIYDQEHHYHCALVIPWPDDEETSGHRKQLDEFVRIAFITKAMMKDPNSFRDKIDSPESLEAELRHSIAHATAQILKAAEFVRRAESDQIIQKPWLAGPGGI